jgi:hypothetical protein
MPRAAIIQPDQSYTFTDYFKLNFAPQDILDYFQASLQRRALELTRSAALLDRLADLKRALKRACPVSASLAKWRDESF